MPRSARAARAVIVAAAFVVTIVAVVAVGLPTSRRDASRVTVTATLPETSTTEVASALGGEVPPLPPIATYVPPAALQSLHGPVPSSTIAIFGDSLTLQAWGYLKAIARAQGRPLVGSAYGGAALCDWFEEIERTLDTVAPGDLVLSFAGNNLTPCIAAPDGSRLFGDALVARYVADAERVLDLAADAGARVTLVGPPAMEDATWDGHARGLRDELHALAQRRGARFVDAGASLSPFGYTATLPCLAHETVYVGCSDGEIGVRAPDGVHLAAPAEGARGYSSGAWRFALALLDGPAG